ncbi:aKG-HExxH-type peptide beta-hydroxylase [Morganella psychrotolerans]|uniref:aKG-HExxH-type peptide beta-hydroxylase n=1 Tax=Morganella psychrotolerans TaxID=368603 RepID=UPI000ACA9C4A|nr:HEXXH motif-containing putative peptide modification protein [Morganella psychrotolerans]
MFNLTFPDYSHQQAYHYFSSEIYASLNYLLDFYKLPEMKPSLPLSWETCAIHYIAGIYAEDEDHSTAITYLNQLKREDNLQQLAISPLSSDDCSFATHIILKIIRDDKQLGFGYCDDNQLAIDETVKLKEALAVIYRYAPDTRQEINQFIHQIYLTQETKDGSRFMRSGTNFYMWGMLFAYVHPSHSVAYYIDILAHECGHTALNILNAQDQLVLNSPDDVFTAPLRDDDRPMIGIFHALFVLSRICHVFDEIIKKKHRGMYR